MTALKKKNRAFQVLKMLGKLRMKRKQTNSSIDEIYRLFKYKRIFQAWKKIGKDKQKMQMIGEKKNPQTFCVKYSDYCRCFNCEQQR